MLVKHACIQIDVEGKGGSREPYYETIVVIQARNNGSRLGLVWGNELMRNDVVTEIIKAVYEVGYRRVKE